eukprot:gene6400-6631_t
MASPVPGSNFPLTSDVIYESTVRMVPDGAGGSAVKAPAWAGSATGVPTIQPTDAHHHMMHEASVLSSHISALQEALQQYGKAADTWFAEVEDFIGSTG